MKHVRVGVIGAGAISPDHCEGTMKHPRGELAAIADIHRGRAREIQALYKIPRIYTDYRDLIASPDIDAVCVALPNALHVPVALAALRAGKHVLIDKPFALNLKEAMKVVEASKAAHRVCMIGMNQRFHPQCQIVKSLVRRGELGEIYFAKACWTRRSGSPRFGTWFCNKKESGGGCVLDIGVHMLDLCLHLLDNFKPITVSGAVYTKFGNRKLGEGGWGKSDPGKHVFDVEDMASGLIRLRGDVTVQLEVSWARHQADPDRQNVELFGTEAGASAYPATLYRYGKAPGEYEVVHPQGVKIAFPHCHRIVHWLDVVTGNAKPACTLQESIAVQRILDALYLSAKTKKEVRIG